MSTLEATVSLLETLPEDRLLIYYNLTKQFVRMEHFENPFKPLTEDELIAKVDDSWNCYLNGEYEDADQVTAELRELYGI